MPHASTGATRVDPISRQLLVIAFHYPPDNSSSGVLRTLKFTQYLLQGGWCSTVLSVPEQMYRDTDPALTANVPPEVSIHRTWAVDLKKKLSIAGSYPGFLAYPDRYWPWLFSAVRRGTQLLRGGRFHGVYSTYPVPTAHLIGLRLKRRFGLPWIADFRDPWLEDSMPWLERRLAISFERAVVTEADRIICNTPAMRRMFLERYPQLDPSKFVTITNGYDEPDFVGLVPVEREKFQIIYPGVIDGASRDPSPLLAGIAAALQRGWLRRDDLIVNFLGSGAYGRHPAFLAAVKAHGLEDVTEVQEARIAYRQALEQLAGGDVLVALCEPIGVGPQTEAVKRWSSLQVPVKVYEYLRLGRPILALVSDGAIAEILARTGGGEVVPPSDVEGIARQLREFYSNRTANVRGTKALTAEVAHYSRANLARLLVAELDSLAAASV
jgi:glycosyltransferase involved in cell wall biosynthesis